MRRSSLINLSLILCLFGTFFVQGCVTVVRPKAYDYSVYLAHMPRSILVLPPQNQSTEVMAPYIYLSTITRPLAERGYYVFPVAVIDTIMKENGISTPEEMAKIPLNKIREIIEPDAILYMTVVEWGVKYEIIDSVTVISLDGKLVDTDTGTVLWQGKQEARLSSSSNQNSIAGILLEAIFNQIINNIVDNTRVAARKTNDMLFLNKREGLLLGPLHRQRKVDQKKNPEILSQPLSRNAGP
jgi:hypothetical protein